MFSREIHESSARRGTVPSETVSRLTQEVLSYDPVQAHQKMVDPEYAIICRRCPICRVQVISRYETGLSHSEIASALVVEETKETIEEIDAIIATFSME